MLTGIFDSHAHYDDGRFDEDREEKLTSIHGEGIEYIINIGADMETSRKAVALAESHDFIYCAVGIHPQGAQDLESDYLAQLEKLAKSPRVKAIGEIGLDYYNDIGDRHNQQMIFAQQLELARRLKLPVVIHNRDAHADTMTILSHYKPMGVVHCFSGSAEMAEQLVKMGMYIGFTGVVTFKNARRAVEAAEAVPLDRLLIETDCPYLAPEPYRGHRCDSSMLDKVAMRLAEIKGVSPEEIVKATSENAKRLFNIK